MVITTALRREGQLYGYTVSLCGLEHDASPDLIDSGNNVFAQDNPSGGTNFELNYRPTAADLNFTFPLHWGCT